MFFCLFDYLVMSSGECDICCVYLQLQDLPFELFEHILVEAIVGEVKDMKLAKSVWKDKADLVIRRHSTVSLQWNCILTSSFFQSELRRTLDATAGQFYFVNNEHTLAFYHAYEINKRVKLTLRLTLSHSMKYQQCCSNLIYKQFEIQVI